MRQNAPAAALAALLLLVAACTTEEKPRPVSEPPPPVEPSEPSPVTFPQAINPDTRAIGANAVYVTRKDDTLLDIARNYDLGYTQLITANRGIDPWMPGVGRNVTLPARYLLPDVPRKGIVINLPQHRLYYFGKDGKTVESFPIGVGVDGRNTPLGTTRVVRKEIDPVWHVPKSIRAEDPDLPAEVGPGPDNPLGDRAMMLGWGGYLIHGTNKPYGVGRNVSHGCIHLYPEDMTHLFNEVPIGTEVRVIDQEAQTAWIGDSLYLAVYPNKRQADALDTRQPVPPDLPAHLKEQVTKAAGKKAKLVDWQAMAKAGRERDGIPVKLIGPGTETPAAVAFIGG